VTISTGAACGRTRRSSRTETAVMGRALARQGMKLWEQAGRWRRGHSDAKHIRAWQVEKDRII